MVPYSILGDEAHRNVAVLLPKLESLNVGEKMYALSVSPKSRQHKMFKLHQVMDEISEVVTPYSACRNGCSFCCSQSVAITTAEAHYISKATGIPYKKPTVAYTPTTLPTYQQKYAGQPCPFLRASRCSIYAYRPLVCRLLYNMSNHPEVCDIVGYPNLSVPYLDTKVLFEASLPILGTEHSDIRHYFDSVPAAINCK